MAYCIYCDFTKRIQNSVDPHPSREKATGADLPEDNPSLKSNKDNDVAVKKSNHIIIPSKFLSKLDITILNDDFSLSKEFCELAGLSQKEILLISGIVNNAGSRLSEIELQSLEIISKNDTRVVLQINPSSEAKSVYERMRTELSQYIAEPFMDLFPKAGDTSGRKGLIAGRGQLKKVLEVNKNSTGEGYSLSEEIFTPAADHSSQSWVSVGSNIYKSFKEIPEYYKHLIEKPENIK